MGRKFYAETEDGDTIFHTERKIGDVRIPNYVYDIWLPIIGSAGMGVYGVYCRLEMNGCVKKMTKAKIAKACRIGTKRLTEINDQLEECGFIRIHVPRKHERLMHYTTEITVLDPPRSVPNALKEKYQPPSKYEVLTPWLHTDDPEKLDDFSEGADQRSPNEPDDSAKIESLGLNPLEVDPPPKKQADKDPVKEEYVDLDPDGYPTKNKHPLVKYIKNNANRDLTDKQQARLARGVPFHNPQHPSPCTLFEKDPRFTEYIDGKIAWATGGADGSKKQTQRLVSAIRNYDHEHYGWLVFKQGAEEEVAHHGLSRYKPVEEPSEEDLRGWEE